MTLPRHASITQPFIPSLPPIHPPPSPSPSVPPHTPPPNLPKSSRLSFNKKRWWLPIFFTPFFFLQGRHHLNLAFCLPCLWEISRPSPKVTLGRPPVSDRQFVDLLQARSVPASVSHLLSQKNTSPTGGSLNFLPSQKNPPPEKKSKKNKTPEKKPRPIRSYAMV